MYRRRPVALVLTSLAAAFVVAGCGDSGSGSDPAAEPASEPAKPVAYESFQSKTGNINCFMDSASGARCDIGQKTWSPPLKPKKCKVDWGFGLTVGSGRGQFLCAGDTVVMPDSPVLGYGKSSSIGPFLCKSEKTGMTCTNTGTGHGFSLSKEAAKTF